VTKFVMLTHEGAACFCGVSHVPIVRGTSSLLSVTKIFVTYMRHTLYEKVTLFVWWSN